MGDGAADASRRRLLMGFGATAALTWTAPKLSSYRAVTSVGTPSPTTEPPTTSPPTTQPPAPRAVRGTATGTTRHVDNQDYEATGTFALRVLHGGTYTVHTRWTALNSQVPLQIGVEGYFELRPSSGGTLFGRMQGHEVWDFVVDHGLFTARWELEVTGGSGVYRSAKGLLVWQGTRIGVFAESTDEFTVDGSLRLP